MPVNVGCCMGCTGGKDGAGEEEVGGEGREMERSGSEGDLMVRDYIYGFSLT